MQMQRNSFAWEVKGIDETGAIEGLAVGYGNVDHGGDKVFPGAATKSIAKRGGVPMLLFHDQKRPVGRWTELTEVPEGIIAKGKISTKTRDGGEAYELVKDGALAGLSMGYLTNRHKMAGKVRELYEIDLIEVSLVTVPMNDFTLISGVKEIEDSRNRLAAGERLSEREWEGLLKDAFGLSNAEAERVVRVHALRNGPGEPDANDEAAAYYAAISS
jgi:HK97 family phage prohead protease